jgi:hypothetical protein
MSTETYDDGSIRVDTDGLLIRRYYFPFGSKRIPYAAITGIDVVQLQGVRAASRWRIWGSGDLKHWWNLDLDRPRKTTALVIRTAAQRTLPTITPDDPLAAEAALRTRL